MRDIRIARELVRLDRKLAAAADPEKELMNNAVRELKSQPTCGTEEDLKWDCLT